MCVRLIQFLLFRLDGAHCIYLPLAKTLLAVVLRGAFLFSLVFSFELLKLTLLFRYLVIHSGTQAVWKKSFMARMNKRLEHSRSRKFYKTGIHSSVLEDATYVKPAQN
jgi:hypothetical protein